MSDSRRRRSGLRGFLFLLVLVGCGIPPPECTWNRDCLRDAGEGVVCGGCILDPDGGCSGYGAAICRESHCISVCAPRR